MADPGQLIDPRDQSGAIIALDQLISWNHYFRLPWILQSKAALLVVNFPLCNKGDFQSPDFGHNLQRDRLWSKEL